MTIGAVDADAHRRNFHLLDGLRGVAAAAVVALHLAPWIAPVPIGSGYLAVDLFFLMSGFVIATAYDRRLAAGMGAAAFLRLRVVRLYPLYLLALVILLLATAAGVEGLSPPGWSRLRLSEAVLAAVLLVPTARTRGALLFPLNPVAGSLFCGLVVNGLHALAFPVLRRHVLWGTVVVFGVLLLVADFRSGSVDRGVQWPDCWLAVPRTGFSFFLGVVLRRGQQEGRLIRPRVPAPLLLLAVLAALMAAPGQSYRPAYDAAAVFLLFPLVLCAAVAREPANPRLHTILGEASYPAYILQVPCIVVMTALLRHLGFDPVSARPWSGLAMVLAVLLLGWVAGVTFDPWARRMLGAWLPPPPGRR